MRSLYVCACRWVSAYGHDFFLSQKMAELVYRYPLLLDAMASEMQRKGDAMMSKWAEIMTNMQVCVCLCVGGGGLSCCC
jgi:hypothetical protein